MRYRLMALNIIWGILTMIASGESLADQPRIFEAGEVCNAIVIGLKTLRMPQHCLAPESQTIYLEGLGSLVIDSIENPGFPSQSTLDTVLIVHLKQNILASKEIEHFSKPKVGRASGAKDGSQQCMISRVDGDSSLVYHSCFGAKGESGRIIYQEGHPVGIHLGRYAGHPIAALGDGSNLDFGEGFDAMLYEPQGFSVKISCCKKAGKLLQKAGDIITDSIEHWRDEIKRIGSEIEKLPKVFSTEYLQEKVSSIQMPSIANVNLNLGGLEKMAWKDVLIIGPTGGVGLVVLASYNFDEERLGRDIERELSNGWEWLIDHLSAKPPKKCESVHKDDMEKCAEELKKDIELYKTKMAGKRGQLKTYVDGRIRKLQE